MRQPEELWARADDVFGPDLPPQADAGYLEHASVETLRNYAQQCRLWTVQAQDFLVRLHAKAAERDATIARMTIELADERTRAAALLSDLKRAKGIYR